MVKFASGGSVKDTVPAMLTPGEYVLNKRSAQQIGYGNLNRMNKSGVKGFNKGGPVGVQYFQDGGDVASGFRSQVSGASTYEDLVPVVTQLKEVFIKLDLATEEGMQQFKELSPILDEANKKMQGFTVSLPNDALSGGTHKSPTSNGLPVDQHQEKENKPLV